jgi:hypothetical protein
MNQQVRPQTALALHEMNWPFRTMHDSRSVRLYLGKKILHELVRIPQCGLTCLALHMTEGVSLLWNVIYSYKGRWQPQTLLGMPCGGRKRAALTKLEVRTIYRLAVKTEAPSRASKVDIVRAVLAFRAVQAIQRRFRKHSKARELLRRAIRRRPRNKICPITLDVITGPVFLYVHQSGYARAYCAESLVNYIVTNGKNADPITRAAYTAVELKRMDRLCKEHKVQVLGSAYAAIHDPVEIKKYEQLRVRAETIDILAMMAGELFDDILRMIRSYGYSSQSFHRAVEVAPRQFRRLRDTLFALGVLEFDRCSAVIDSLHGKMDIVRITFSLKALLAGLLDAFKESIQALVVGAGPATLSIEEEDDDMLDVSDSSDSSDDEEDEDESSGSDDEPSEDDEDELGITIVDIFSSSDDDDDDDETSSEDERKH